MKKNSLTSVQLIFLAFIFFFPTQVFGADDQQDWEPYRDEKYKYEIKYPTGYELHLTGLPKDRDGKSFRIGIKNMAAFHGLFCEIKQGQTIDQIASDKGFPISEELKSNQLITEAGDQISTWSKANFNDSQLIKGETKFKATNEIFHIYIIMDQIICNASLYNRAGFDVDMVDNIISTLKIY